ncbi:hypothetical protein D7X12_38060 [Corallococcus sicarius]|uniref:Uncharacterized protein n=1 Tax=Corallococcus sicarius TaxID=2316726 RepID=A0A3A8MH82_9BACT|nr:hypothetical protein D7X12_38060 [Corallococcus sicarius]
MEGRRCSPQGHTHFQLELQPQVVVLQVLPLYQEHVVLPPAFPQNVMFRASQSGAIHVQPPSEHTAASAVPMGSSANAGPESGTPPQATSSPDSKDSSADFFR